MIKTSKKLIGLIVSLSILFACGEQENDAEDVTDLTTLVNPYIGTGNSTVPSVIAHGELANENKGQTFPAVGVPYAVTNWTPQTRATEQKCISPYYYADDKIQGIRGSHWMSGSCTQDYGSLTIMPMGNELVIDAEARASEFDHEQEIVRPDYYWVNFLRYQVEAEVTGLSRSGILRFKWKDNEPHHVIIEPNSDEGEGYIKIDPEKKEVVGYNPVHRIYQGWGKPAGFSGYFVAQFEQDFQNAGTWLGSQVQKDVLDVEGNGEAVGAFLVFDDANEVIVKIGTSFTSIENARENLEAEIPDFDFEQVQLAAKQEWQKALQQIEVTGGTEDQQVMFYSAMYHAKLLPRVFNDLDGSYPGFADDNEVHIADGYNYHVDFTTWDSYRAVHPLMTIIEPSRSLEIVKTVIDKAEQGGWLPIFPCWNHYTAGMIGDHLVSVVGDAYLKGIDDFDQEKAYRYMRQNAFELPQDFATYEDGKGRRALDSYLKYGYIPMEDSVKEAFHKMEQVSRTLEYAYDDFVLARVAQKMMKQEDYEKLTERAGNYKHVFDTTVGFVRGRYADGSWYEPFNPNERAVYITEGTPFHYTWYVPQDVAGLIGLMGGRQQMVEKLDHFFETGEYWHGNEPGHHIPYLFAWGGAPWKTQQWIREIMHEEYSNQPGGLSGNDDVGQMSAWLVFSMVGMYPVTPGIPVYVLGSPVFEEVKFNLENGNQFVIEAENNSDENMYIQSALLNGEPLTRAWINHQEIMDGGLLQLEMGPKPNKAWGADPKDAPPSLSGQPVGAISF